MKGSFSLLLFLLAGNRGLLGLLEDFLRTCRKVICLYESGGGDILWLVDFCHLKVYSKTNLPVGTFTTTLLRCSTYIASNSITGRPIRREARLFGTNKSHNYFFYP